MPIYEEKLICPLAVRFTQGHIRPVFQDKFDLEETIKQFKTRPGTGDYDVILETPFKNIEVVRWFQPDSEHKEKDEKHWFTLDNRRLYCLQKAAAQLWPRKVAITVELLYAATDGMKRKDDSLNVGRSVGIGHSLKNLSGRWDWRQAVQNVTADVAQHESALRLVAADDAKRTVEDLSDAPAQPGMLDLFYQNQSQSGGISPTAKSENHSEESTAHPTSPRSLNSSEDTTSPVKSKHGKQATKQAANPKRRQEVQQFLSGTWLGAGGKTYDIDFTKQDIWTCVRTGHYEDYKSFTLWHDEPNDVVWWGTNWKMYLNLSEARKEGGDCLKWRGGNDAGNGKPHFTWQRSEDTDKADEYYESGHGWGYGHVQTDHMSSSVAQTPKNHKKNQGQEQQHWQQQQQQQQYSRKGAQQTSWKPAKKGTA